jgi:ATP phosphoribosyltransferase regulatory subunit HisZ
MQSHTAEEIRNKVDLLRHTVESDASVHQQIKSDLLGLLEKHGLLEGVQAELLEPADALHHMDSMHICPWDTCEATRHG